MIIDIKLKGVWLKADIEGITGGGGDASYLVYTALLSQAGTDAPTAIELENTIGSATWSYIEQGVFNLTTAGGFPDANKVIPFFATSGADKNIVGYQIDEDTFQINVATTADGTPVDGGISNASIEIRVYPSII